MSKETTVNCRIKPYIQPFERTLAVRELASIAEGVLAHSSTETEFTIKTAVSPKVLADRLAYWEQVQAGRSLLTTQVLREATVSIARNGVPFDDLASVLPFKNEPVLPNRRCLRYGPHGIHEYRGKFFPQLVRALLNAAGLSRGGVVADPMCGSGTTVVETALLGCNGVGLDLNPLSVFIARTKSAILHANTRSISRTHNVVRDKLRSRSSMSASGWFNTFSTGDQEYLRRWFSPNTLRGLDRVVDVIRSVRTPRERDLLWVCLSNILRRVSYQKEDDLRVRREAKRDVNPVEEFIEEMTKSIRMVLTLLFQIDGSALGSAAVVEGDARNPMSAIGRWAGRIDVIVTSPPYATALPYLDTDRLSLIYLKLLPRDRHRRHDQQMVGNREITDSTRREYWANYCKRRDHLPTSIVRLIDHVNDANTSDSVGFRRKNLGALLGKYFIDMEAVFAGMRSLLRRRAPAFVVIGSNHTYAGGKRVEIPTAAFLGELAAQHGFVVDDVMPMEMLTSRDIFRKNASASETILTLRRRS